MKTRTKVFLFAAIALLCCSCNGGPDPIRLRSERANLVLAKRCADGWFQGLPFTADDERLVRNAFADWERVIAADEKLLQLPLPGGQK